MDMAFSDLRVSGGHVETCFLSEWSRSLSSHRVWWTVILCLAAQQYPQYKTKRTHLCPPKPFNHMLCVYVFLVGWAAKPLLRFHIVPRCPKGFYKSIKGFSLYTAHMEITYDFSDISKISVTFRKFFERTLITDLPNEGRWRSCLSVF